MRAALRLAVLIFVAAVVMIPCQRADTAEQVVTVLAAIVGALFIAAVVLVMRLTGPRTPPDPPSGRPRDDGR
jgi:hypothetical protein